MNKKIVEVIAKLSKKHFHNVELIIDEDGYINVVNWSNRCHEYAYLETFENIDKLLEKTKEMEV